MRQLTRDTSFAAALMCQKHPLVGVDLDDGTVYFAFRLTEDEFERAKTAWTNNTLSGPLRGYWTNLTTLRRLVREQTEGRHLFVPSATRRAR